jgi:hypothetical protein
MVSVKPYPEGPILAEPLISQLIQSKYFDYQRGNVSGETSPARNLSFMQTSMSVITGSWMSLGNNTANIRSQVHLWNFHVVLFVPLSCLNNCFRLQPSNQRSVLWLLYFAQLVYHHCLCVIRGTIPGKRVSLVS